MDRDPPHRSAGLSEHGPPSLPTAGVATQAFSAAGGALPVVSDVTRTELQNVLRAQQRRVVAHLARSLGLGHLALAEDAVQTASTGRFAGELDDDELALLFAACHPALPAASQVALALRAHTLAAAARAHERLGERGQAGVLLRQAQAAAQHPADARQLARHALLLSQTGAA